jgi:hypothetical protein
VDETTAPTDRFGGLILYRFYCRRFDGKLLILHGGDLRAVSAEHAMNQIEFVLGLSAKRGWYAEPVMEWDDPIKQ